MSVSVSGLPGAVVKTVPGELALFPGASGTTVVTVELPAGFPAGRHEAKVEARARVSAAEAASCDFVLDVEPVSRATLSVSPLTRKGQRKIAVLAFGRKPRQHVSRCSARRLGPGAGAAPSVHPGPAFYRAGVLGRGSPGCATAPAHFRFRTRPSGDGRRDGHPGRLCSVRPRRCVCARRDHARPSRGEVHLCAKTAGASGGGHRLGAGVHCPSVGWHFHFCDEHGARPTKCYQICPPFVFRPYHNVIVAFCVRGAASRVLPAPRRPGSSPRTSPLSVSAASSPGRSPLPTSQAAWG